MLPATAIIVAMLGTMPTCRTVDRRVETVVEHKARELDGHEYCQFRRYDTIDDLDGDGTDDFVMTFAVEGVHKSANDALHFLAALASRNRWKPAVLQIGRRGERQPRSFTVEPGLITVDFNQYLPNDPMCCPSGMSRESFRLDGATFVAPLENP